jgi:hypothetical protein
MQANPDKFQFLAVGRKTYDKNPSIHIQNFNLTCESTVKLLGRQLPHCLNGSYATAPVDAITNNSGA